ncbi:CRE-GLNA-3 protein [Caenorhabditis remanei]|uniref:glutaminase n=1 Tax=Caenorhabditis remanei TaxID=31234 RepID=E3NFE4_CAERE|nr:CRE-GLNA-3 protein [Caenorhabditis remanei]
MEDENNEGAEPEKGAEPNSREEEEDGPSTSTMTQEKPRTPTVVQFTKPSFYRVNTVISEVKVCRSMSYDMCGNHQQELLFDLYKDETTGKVYLPRFFKALLESGIRKDDPRIDKMIQNIKDADLLDDFVWGTQHIYLEKDTFKKYIGSSIGVVTKALKKQMIIPDWERFVGDMGEIFEDVRQYDEGELATYIPQLSRVPPDSWAMSVCTIDGQRKSWGDSLKPFCLQSVSKPFTYALVHDDIGAEALHAHVGQEPSGRLFNDICLDHNKKPHNPLINAGAIVVASLLKHNTPLADRFDFMIHACRKFVGSGYIGFNNSVFLSERETADRNYALSYYMREHNVFPKDLNLQDTLDLYFQICSIETNCDSLAVMAATLANGGVNPMNGERVINNRACRDTLSLMYSCGMYDWSGQFAFHVGLPAKSGVSGDMIIVIPNVMGIALYSPRLDKLGNTVRGVKFAEQLVQKYNFHNYDSLIYSDNKKIDPRRQLKDDHDGQNRFMYATKLGDIAAIKRFLLMGHDIHCKDYDNRTVLHVAAAEGDVVTLEYVLSKWMEDPDPHDRYDRTPLDDAKHFNHTACIKMLEEAITVFNLKQQDD